MIINLCRVKHCVSCTNPDVESCPELQCTIPDGTVLNLKLRLDLVLHSSTRNLGGTDVVHLLNIQLLGCLLIGFDRGCLEDQELHVIKRILRILSM